jgi:hypothetical protein
VLVRLVRHLVFRVAVRVNRSVQLLKRHERQHQLIIGVEQAAQPLLVLDEVYL